jgi:hypothetical protein
MDFEKRDVKRKQYLEGLEKRDIKLKEIYKVSLFDEL